jgi:hypothetical protein
MNSSFLKEADLAKVLALLENHTFVQVALIFGYKRKGGDSCVRKFLTRHGINPKFYAKANKHDVKFKLEQVSEHNWRPKLIKTYFENGVLIKRYEARYAQL